VSARVRRAALMLALGAGATLAGCAPRSATHGDAVTRATCQQRADQIFAMRNPEQRYAQDVYQTSTRDAPFSSFGLNGMTDRGLGDQYARDKLYDDCLKSTGGGVGPTPAAPPGTPSAAAPAVTIK
jgi:hypothetical protein